MSLPCSRISFIIPVLIFLHLHKASGAFPSEWISSKSCTFNAGWVCTESLSICAVRCYQFQNNKVEISYPVVRLIPDSFAATTLDLERGSGDSSSFTYVDSLNGGDFRCSKGSLKNNVLLLKELQSSLITSSTTAEECETLGFSQLNTKIFPKFSNLDNSDSLASKSTCPLTGVFQAESVSSNGAEVCSSGDGATVSFTGDSFVVNLCGDADQASKTLDGIQLDTTEFFCVNSFDGDFINGDATPALVFYYNSSQTYMTAQGNIASRYHYSGIRYSYDGRGSYNFSMYFGGSLNESSFLNGHTPTTTGVNYATFKLYNCPNYECPGEDNVCLLSSERCNGVNDCQDGSDELNCQASQRSADATVCCNIPSSLRGLWYWGRSAPIILGRLYSLINVTEDGCETNAITTLNSLTGSLLPSINASCEISGEMIGESFYIVEYSLVGYTCRSFTPAGSLRFERTIGNVSSSFTPADCKGRIEGSSSNTLFGIQLKAPPIVSNEAVTMPWSADVIGKALQASVKQATSVNLCQGDTTSTVTLTSDSIQIKLCDRTNIPAIGIDEVDVDMKVLQTWSGSDMSPLANDSLGTFLLLTLNDQAILDSNSAVLYAARFLKTSSSTYSLAVNWKHEIAFDVDAMLDPTVHSSDSNIRVYDLIDTSISSSSQSTTEASSSQEADASLMATGTTAMPTDTQVMPTGTTAMPTGTEVMPTGTIVMPTNTEVMPTGTQVMPTGTTVMPTGTGIMPPGTEVMPTGTEVMPTGTITSGTLSDIQPSTTSETPASTASPEGKVGVAEVTVDGDFSAITGGNGDNYCQHTESQIAEKANVTVERVDNTDCVPGSVKITTEISEGTPQEIGIEEALNNLEAAVKMGFFISSPDGLLYAVNTRFFTQFIRYPNESISCGNETCEVQAPVEAVGATDDDDGNRNIIIYTAVAAGVVIILITIITVIVRSVKQQEPSGFRRMPFQEEDGFGMVKQWQANYKLSLKR